MPNATERLPISWKRAGPDVTTYPGLCEASTGVFLDDRHFAVASDEINVLRIYRRGDPDEGDPVRIKLKSYDKSDLEASARIGKHIYWLSSHSLTSDKEDKAKRKLLLSTRIIRRKHGKPGLKIVGHYSGLRDHLLERLGPKVGTDDLNIEGLAATPSGHLLIGLRNVVESKALLVPLLNPADVIERGEAPALSDPIVLHLDGLGVRSIEAVPDGYLIVAGPPGDAGSFALFTWGGPGVAPVPVPDVDFESLRPEVVMWVPGTDIVQVLSDDGSDDFDDEQTGKRRRMFRSIDLKRHPVAE